MTDKQHADIGPSKSKQWMTCTPSVRLEKIFKGDGDEESEYAREGTLAHLLAEALLGQRFGILTPYKVLTMLEKVQGDAMYNQQMQDYIDDYVDYVTEIFNTIRRHDKHAIILLEQRIDLTSIIPEGFGTGDVVIIGAKTVVYIDLKYGVGVKVEAEENEQAFLYVYGLYDEHSFIHHITHAQIHIYQPRLSNIDHYEYDIDVILDWAEKIAKPAALKAFKGVGEFVAGAHCKFCKALRRCRKAAEYNLQLAPETFKDPELLSDEEVVDILMRKGEFMSWIKAVADYAAHKAREGHQFPGMKLVNGKADRVYTNEERIAEILLQNGYTRSQIFNKKLKSITEMEKLLGKKKFETYLNGLVHKPTGAPTLVPVTDKRITIGSVASANRDFE